MNKLKSIVVEHFKTNSSIDTNYAKAIYKISNLKPIIRSLEKSGLVFTCAKNSSGTTFYALSSETPITLLDVPSEAAPAAPRTKKPRAPRAPLTPMKPHLFKTAHITFTLSRSAFATSFTNFFYGIAELFLAVLYRLSQAFTAVFNFLFRRQPKPATDSATTAEDTPTTAAQ